MVGGESVVGVESAVGACVGGVELQKGDELSFSSHLIRLRLFLLLCPSLAGRAPGLVETGSMEQKVTCSTPSLVSSTHFAHTPFSLQRGYSSSARWEVRGLLGCGDVGELAVILNTGCRT